MNYTRATVYILLESNADTKLIALTINGLEHQLAATEPTLAVLVMQMGLGEKRIAVEHNGNIVPRTAFATTFLREGDKLEIVGAVGGG